MRDDQRLLKLPASVAARYLVLQALASADRAGAEVRESDGPAARAGFGAALTRLRDLLHIFRAPLRESVRRRDRRSVSELCRLVDRVSNHAALVHWLTIQEVGRTDDRAPGVDRLLERLRDQSDPLEREFLRRTKRDFPRFSRRLRKRLATYRVAIDAKRTPSLPLFGDFVHGALPRLVGAWQKRLEPLGIGERQQLRRSRILTSRLFHLVEVLPVQPTDKATVADRLVHLAGSLDRLQEVDFAGRTVLALRDVAAETDMPLAEVHVWLRDLHQRRAVTIAELRSWLFRSEIEGVVEHLAPQPRDPYTSGIAREDLEIERKFLLREFPEIPAEDVETLEVEQGWLPGERLLERLRRTRSAAGETLFRAVKLGRGVSRIEIEEATDPVVFEHLWPLTEGRRVRKTRFRIMAGESVWEIDRFHDRDLVLAEIELTDAEAEVVIPAWLSGLIVREVTDEPKYLNVNLAG